MDHKKWRSMPLNYALHDQAHCEAPGLFRALQRGERKLSKLDVTYNYGDNKLIEFKGPEPLGADDLVVLQGLLANASSFSNTSRLTPEPKSDIGQALRTDLEPKWNAVKADAIVTHCSYGQLARAIGYPEGGKTFNQMRKCIERLWTVSIIAQDENHRQGFKLLSSYASNNKAKQLYVALNPIIAQAIIGGHHIRIEMDEVRAIKNENTRLIHQRLCGWINQGESGKITIDTLCEYVWPDSNKANEETKKKHKTRIKKALQILEDIGWKIEEYNKEKYIISRPKKKENPTEK
jgi:hypothetical protein